jgi:hypothetical protein
MDDGEGLDLGEQLVLSGLEDSPVPLWELGWAEAPSRQRVAKSSDRDWSPWWPAA